MAKLALGIISLIPYLKNRALFYKKLTVRTKTLFTNMVATFREQKEIVTKILFKAYVTFVPGFTKHFHLFMSIIPEIINYIKITGNGQYLISNQTKIEKQKLQIWFN